MLPPLRRQLRINEQARGRRFEQAGGVIDRLLTASARDSLPSGELELAWRVVTTVAYDAAPFDDRLHVLAIRHSRDRLDGNIEALRVGLPITLIKLVQGNRGAAGDPDRSE